MKRSMTRRGDEGLAMLVGLVFVSVALMITGVISMQLVSQGRQVDAYQDLNATYQALDNANELARLDIDAGGDGIFGLDAWTPEYDNTGRIVLPELDASGVEPIEMEVMSSEDNNITLTMRFIAYTVNWQTDMRDTNGDGVSADPNDVPEQGLFTVHAKAEVMAPDKEAFVVEMESPLMLGEMQMASAFDVQGLVDDVQFAKVGDAAMSTYTALPALVNGQTDYSTSNTNVVVRQSEAIHRSRIITVWGNAIFAGDGAIGATINGNVSICGGVHILGEGMLMGMPAITSPDDPSMEMSGTSFIHNNYNTGGGSLAPARMWQSIPALPTKLVNGENVKTLNANLRVKHGTVNMQGNAEVGEPNVAGNADKEFMDGTYVTDGFSATNHVHSDNGYNEDYDLGNKLAYPMLDDQYRDKTTKQPITDPTNPNGPGGTYTHQDYFTEVLVGDPNNPTDGILKGNITLTPGGCTKPYDGLAPAVSEATGLDSPVDNQFEMASEVEGIQFGNIADATLSGSAVLMPTLMQTAPGGGGGGGCAGGNFYYNATKGKLYQQTAYAAIPVADLPAATDDYIMFDSTANTLKANGQIAIEGNLTISGGNGAVVDFTGKAAFLVTDGTQPGDTPNTTKGNVVVEVDLLSKNTNGSVVGSFPSNTLGFMADSNLTLGNGAHRNIMGPFYAEGTVMMNKQSQVMGTIVGSYFNIGNQVPNIYQVPNLETNLPFGMIGEIPIVTLSLLSWREIIPTES